MEPYVIAVDFDGTLCENKWPEIGRANIDLIYHLKTAKLEGTKLILWTCRTKELLEEAVNWCSGYGLEFDAVNSNLPEYIEKFGEDTRKVFAHEYIDDRANTLFKLPYKVG